MRIDTFDDPRLHSAIIVVTERISQITDENKRQYLCKFISEFNTLLKPIPRLSNTTHRFKVHILELIRIEYLEKVDDANNRKVIEDELLYTYLRNYLVGKIRYIGELIDKKDKENARKIKR
jgi:hypothetical protein